MQDNNLDGSRKGSTGYRVYKNTSMYSKNASQMEQITLCYFLPAHSWCKRVQTPLHQHATPLSHQSNNANLRWLVINEQNIRREKQVSLRSVDLLRTNFGQQYIGNHIILNASDTILA